MPMICCHVKIPVPSANLSGTATWNNSDIQTWLLLLEYVLKYQAYVATKCYLEA